MAAPTLHITVAAITAGGDANDLSHEARLVKAALLYADRVTLVSVKAKMLEAISQFANAGDAGRDQFIEGMLRTTDEGPELVAALTALRQRRKGSLRPEEVIRLAQINARMKRARGEVDEVLEGLLSHASVGELGQAVQAGVLDFHPMGMERWGDKTEGMVREFVAVLAEAVSPTTTTFPMFDDSAGGLIKAMLAEGQVPGASVERASHVGLAGHYIQQVETFADAPMGAILDARAALASPLTGFRSAISNLAKELRTTPLDAGFAAEADNLYIREVAPQLQEVHRLAEERKLLRLLRREVTTVQPAAVLSSVIGFGVTTTFGLSDVVTIAATAAPTVAGVIGGTKRRQAELDEKRQANKFLWLYEVPGQLKRRGR